MIWCLLGDTYTPFCFCFGPFCIDSLIRINACWSSLSLSKLCFVFIGVTHTFCLGYLLILQEGSIHVDLAWMFPSYCFCVFWMTHMIFRDFLDICFYSINNFNKNKLSLCIDSLRRPDVGPCVGVLCVWVDIHADLEQDQMKHLRMGKIC